MCSWTPTGASCYLVGGQRLLLVPRLGRFHLMLQYQLRCQSDRYTATVVPTSVPPTVPHTVPITVPITVSITLPPANGYCC